MPTTTMVDRKRLADFETHWAVTQFLHCEAEVLDDRRLDLWAEMLTDDFRYRLPTPVTWDDPSRPPYSEDSFLVEETRQSINLWIRRHEPGMFEYAWGENPPQRTRHFITNIRVREGDTAGEFHVRSNVLLGFARQSDPETLTTAGRDDVLRQVDGEWRLASRVAYFDQAVHTLTHLRLII